MARLIEQEFRPDQRGLCLAVSAPDGERYSTEAILMLAYCLQSELGQRTLVVDCRPAPGGDGITERLGLHDAQGFMDCLTVGPGMIEGAVVPSAISGVDVLPLGSPALADVWQDREHVAAFVQACATRYGYVLMQVGPVVKDTRNILASAAADVTFLVVAENRTLMAELGRHQEVLLANGVTDVRVVVTSGD